MTPQRTKYAVFLMPNGSKWLVRLDDNRYHELLYRRGGNLIAAR